MAVRYINPTALGTGDGSSAANAALLTSIDSQVLAAGPGGEVILLPGLYTPVVSATPFPINNGGTPGNPVTIRGDASTGTILRGTRAEPWVVDATDGDPCFRLHASNLTFRWLHFERFGNGCLLVHPGVTISNIIFEDWTANNIQRVFEIYEGGTINTLDIRRGTADYFSKGIIRLQGDTNDVRITDVTGNGRLIDGDPINFAFQCIGTVHHVTYDNCHGEGGIFSGNPYWNGDTFVTEELNHHITYRNCSAKHNADGGWDVKGDDILIEDCVAEDNKRNFRLWGSSNVVLNNVTGIAPVSRGGIGTVAHVHVASNGNVVVNNSTFSGGGPEVFVYQTENGAGTFLHVNNCSVTHHAEASLTRQGTGSLIIIDPEPPHTDPDQAIVTVTAGSLTMGANEPFPLTTAVVAISTGSPTVGIGLSQSVAYPPSHHDRSGSGTYIPRHHRPGHHRDAVVNYL